jgi:predicted deacylase
MSFEIFHSLNPAWSIAIVTGQHGDEYAGLEAGAKMIEYVRASLAGRSMFLRDGQARRLLRPPLDLSGVTVLAAPAVNTSGIRHGTRWYDPAPEQRFTRDTAGPYEGIDLNRCWPEHPVLAPIWEAILGLPRPIVVLDVHSTWRDRTGDGRPDSHVYVTGRSRAWVEPLLAGWLLVDEPGSIRSSGGPIEEVANRMGMYGVTVELDEDEGAPGIKACDLLRRLILAGAPHERTYSSNRILDPRPMGGAR